ncbi:MAG: ParB/RepB/Spo0J family partition protein [Lachnospiraceae bacterium]|nr:ParB/RepB/Spo0J family partition protein [Ruminococcus sp.]MCM1274779.1 ParB/RepB/Spo0J family partition protein [Lachnospiraceae bacterium]
MTGLFKQKEKIAGQIVMLELGELTPNKSQPRRQFSEEQLLSLSQSIKENGIIQPICVRKKGAVYEIISGERRTRAARLAGLTEVPCIVMTADDEQSAVLALIENIQRQDLSYFEEALAIEKLISFYGLTQESAAARLGKAQSTIANKLRLLRFTDAERRMLITGNLNERQARALIRIEDESARLKAIERVTAKNLNLAQTEELVNMILNGVPKREKKQRKRLPITAPPRLYMNSLNALLKRIKDDKVPCELTAEKSDRYYEYTIKFPINI